MEEDVGSRGGMTRRPKMEVARAAFAQNNREVSRLAHSTGGSAPAICERGHKTHAFPTDIRKFVEVAVRGGNQGVIFCCVLATGLEALGPHAGPPLVLPFCVLALVGLALTLGFLDYANRQAEKTFGENEREREKWECENYLEGEQKEMVELYVTKGMSNADAETVIKLLSKNQELFLDIMMAEELGILPYSGLPPHLSGLVTGLGFLGIGALPLLAYSYALTSVSSGNSIVVLLGLAAVILFVLGGIKNFYCIDLEAWWKQGVYMLGLQIVVVTTILGLGALLQTSPLFPHARLLLPHTSSP